MLCIVFFLSCSVTPDASDRAIVIPFTIENGFIVLEATINRNTGRFFWDNGANYSSFPHARSHSRRSIYYTVVGGEHTLVPFYRLDSVSFGNNIVRAESLITRQINDISGRLAALWGLDGMLGNCIFNGFWLELSFSRSEIVLHMEKPAHFANASHAPLRSMQDMGRISDRRLYLPVDVNGREFNMLIDTGARYSFAFPADIVNYKDPGDVRHIISRLNPWNYYLVRTESLNILDRVYHDKLIMTNSHFAERINEVTGVMGYTDIGIIGLNFMRDYDLLMDYRDLWNGISEGMFFIPITPPEERTYGLYSVLSEAPEFGITNLSSHMRGLNIVSILTDSPAYTVYGLRPGSIIRRINGQLFHNFSRAELLDPKFFDRATSISVLNAEGVEELILLQGQ